MDPVAKFWEADGYTDQMIFKGAAMVKDFREWAQRNHFSYSQTKNHQEFYRMLADCGLPMRTVEKSGRTYLSMVPMDVYKELAKKHFVDHDEGSICFTAHEMKAEETGGDEFDLEGVTF